MIQEGRADIGAQFIRMEGTLDLVSLSLEDRHAAYCAGYDDGMHYQAGLDVEDRARAMLVEWSNESRNMATHYAAKVGPHWLELISDCGGPE